MVCSGSCNSNPCACNAVPVPYYEEGCFQQSQSQGYRVFHQYSPVIRISTGWAVPELGSILTLKVAALADMMIGAVISNPVYGDYEVVSYEPDEQLIKVTKTFYNTKTVGTVIPSCSKFLVTANSYESIIEYLSSFFPTLNYQEVTATGTDETDAVLITGNVVNVVGANGTNGAILTEYNVGNVIYIYNADASDSFELYPPSGAQFNGGGADVPFTFPALTGITIVCYSATEYVFVIGTA